MYGAEDSQDQIHVILVLKLPTYIAWDYIDLCRKMGCAKLGGYYSQQLVN